MNNVATLAVADREALFRNAHRKTERILPAFIEKDFWVCWTLHRVFEVIQFRPHLIFKGGTSLSKVYRVIDRFSEDVDLSLSRRDLGFAGDHDPEQAGISKKEAKRRLEALVEACKTAVRDALMPALHDDFAGILGPDGWAVELDPLDVQTILFTYPSTGLSGAMPYVKPVIRLEMGARSDDWPAMDAEVQPYAAEAFPEQFAMPVAKVRTLASERTFWEKATLLHAECHRPLDKPDRDRHARHYYDLARLALQPVGEAALQRFDLLERVIAHKSFFFASRWANYETARPGTFRLLPDDADRLENLRRDYEDMETMIFGDAPSWYDLAGILRDLERRINQFNERGVA